MEEAVASRLAEIEEEIRRLPASVLEEFKVASGPMSKVLTGQQIVQWAQTGAEVSKQTVRSWEAAVQYYKVSPEVVGYMPFSYFVTWAQAGSKLCEASPSLATAYFQASPAAMKKLRSRHIESWAHLGGTLYKGTWKSSTLSCRFFEATPELLESLTFKEVCRFVAFLEALSNRSYDHSAECLALSRRLFSLVGDDKEAFISLASTLVDTGWRQVKSFFEASSRALPRVDPGQRLRFLQLAEGLVSSGDTNIPTVMLEISQALGQLEHVNHERVLKLSESLLKVSPSAVPDFVKSCPPVLDRITMNRLEVWFEEGLRVLQQNSDRGIAFFRIESARSEALLEALSSAVEFSRVKDVLQMYCRALAGAEIKLSDAGQLVGKNIGWVSSEAPSTEGSTVFLPPLVDRYSSKDQNFLWFKVVSTHQVSHLEFGSFRFDFDRPSNLFKDVRMEVEERNQARALDDHPEPQPNAEGVERAWLTDMQRFFSLFDDRRLALEIFTVVEDGRLDARVKFEYPGIRRTYTVVQSDAIQERPEVQFLPMREAMVELLVRLSLQQDKRVPAPSPYVEEARRIVRIARRVFSPEATVEDVSEATIRIYAILSQIPNVGLPEEEWEDLDLEDAGDDSYMDGEEEDVQGLLQQLGQPMEPEEEQEQEFQSIQDVDYRGDFKPELVQLLETLRGQRHEAGDDSVPISSKILEEFLKESAELDLEAVPDDMRQTGATFANNILKEAGLHMPPDQEFGQGPLVHVDEEGGSLEVTEPQTFVYDEWDFRAEDYKPRWCIVRQKSMAEGDDGYYGNILHSYGSLVTQIRRQFELMVPEMFRKVRKLEDGEEIDFDDVVEAFVDMRTGVSPSDKLYWRRNKVLRDVAVVFLLDISASTAEAIDEARKLAGDWDAPDDPVEYMAWLRTRRGDRARRSYKRIIDVEKEAVVLLINALESIGDVYGIYGFSGYGRENVEFYTIKDIEESFSARVKKRIDRIAPLHATRMGPAIRHATYKLENQDARTKLLFLISDGRPQDRGYSREGVEKEYAVHDTKMAFTEANRKDVQTFCLTVDKNGHDYLGTMCQDMGYEILDDIYALPQRLLFLYKRLTM